MNAYEISKNILLKHDIIQKNYEISNMLVQQEYMNIIKGMNIPSNVVKFGQHELILNEQQYRAVNADLNKNILIFSCAGSGKTSTVLCRIKHIIEHGVKPYSIVLTTFTKFAANDMTQKLSTLYDIKKIGLEIGTIDSIAKKNIYRYANELVQNNLSVSEYSPMFLEFLKNHPNGKKYLSTKKYLFVDEYQDINETQFNIIKEFYNAGCKIIVVGDDAQNIYSFRGSNIEYILTFEKTFSNVESFMLNYNYRSTPEIIDFANESIEKNKRQIPKKMIAVHKSIYQKPVVQYFHNWNDQNEYIINKINYFIKIGIPYEEIAILSRNSKGPLNYLEEELTKRKIPTVMLEGKEDYKINRKTGHVCISTIHKAKGLEWTVVFITSCSDALFPANKTVLDIEEDRRLFYVGVTRAKKYLYLSYTSVKDPRTNIHCNYVSRYISEIDRRYYDFVNYNDKLIGKSSKCIDIKGTTITELIEELDGCDYQTLRNNKIVPILQFKEEELYKPYTYNKFIVDNDLYADFGIFIDTLISRQFGEFNSLSNGLYNYSSLRAVANIKLVANELAVYNKYIYNFKFNLHFLNNSDDIINCLEFNKYTALDNDIRKNIKKIDRLDEKYIVDIVNKIKFHSRKYNIPMEYVPIFPENFLPQEFEYQMRRYLQIFCDKKTSFSDIISEIWEVSKCDQIVREQRRRLLYKDININDILSYKNLYNDIFNTFVKKNCNKNIKCHKSFALEILDEIIEGDIDVLIDDTIVDYKTSISTDVKAEWIVQLLCYAYMCQCNDIKVNYIEIFNTLTGKTFTADISGWNNGKELLNYMITKHHKLMTRTHEYEQEKQTKKIIKVNTSFEQLQNETDDEYLDRLVSLGML